MKCQAEGHPTGAISLCQGCSWAFRDTHLPGHQGLHTSLRCRCCQNLGTVHIPWTLFCFFTHTRALCLWMSTRDGSDHVVWGCSHAPPGISQACTLHQALMEAEFLRGAQGDLCFCLVTFPTALPVRVSLPRVWGVAVCVCALVFQGLGDTCCRSLCSWLVLRVWRGHPCVPSAPACFAALIQERCPGLVLLEELLGIWRHTGAACVFCRKAESPSAV